MRARAHGGPAVRGGRRVVPRINDGERMVGFWKDLPLLSEDRFPPTLLDPPLPILRERHGGGPRSISNAYI